MKNLRTVSDAFSWYLRPREAQYVDAENTKLYDLASSELTQRRAFGKFLIGRLGALGDVLEIGAGTGLISAEIVKANSGAVISELEDAPIEILKKRIPEANIVKAIHQGCK